MPPCGIHTEFVSVDVICGWQIFQMVCSWQAYLNKKEKMLICLYSGPTAPQTENTIWGNLCKICGTTKAGVSSAVCNCHKERKGHFNAAS